MARQPVATLTITYYDDGALCVEGHIDDKEWVLAALDHAKDSIRSHHMRKHAAQLVPGRDVSLPDVTHPLPSIGSRVIGSSNG